MVVLFDTETTGKTDMKGDPLGAHQPDLVQLAAVLMNAGGSVLGQINLIVEPSGWVISEEVAAIHKINQNLAESAGVPRKIALASFNHLCKHATKLVAHNLDFDWLVMLVNYHREKAPHRMGHLQKVCTMKAATDRVKIPSPYKRGQFKWPTLAETYAHYFNGATFDGAHNAMVDVLALCKVYWEMERLGHLGK